MGLLVIDWRKWWALAVVAYLVLFLVTPRFERVAGMWTLNGLLFVCFMWSFFFGRNEARKLRGETSAWLLFCFYFSVFFFVGVLSNISVYGLGQTWRFIFLDTAFFAALFLSMLRPIGIHGVKKIETYSYWVLGICVILYLIESLSVLGQIGRNNFANSRSLPLLQILALAFPLLCKFFGVDVRRAVFFCSSSSGCIATALDVGISRNPTNINSPFWYPPIFFYLQNKGTLERVPLVGRGLSCNGLCRWDCIICYEQIQPRFDSFALKDQQGSGFNRPIVEMSPFVTPKFHNYDSNKFISSPSKIPEFKAI